MNYKALEEKFLRLFGGDAAGSAGEEHKGVHILAAGGKGEQSAQKQDENDCFFHCGSFQKQRAVFCGQPADVLLITGTAEPLPDRARTRLPYCTGCFP